MLEKNFALFTMFLFLLGAHSSFASDVSLNQSDCRFYVESAADETMAHEERISLFLRTQSGFDSAIAKVGFAGHLYWTDGYQAQSEATDVAIEAVPGYGDLFHTSFAVSGDNDVPGIYNTRMIGSFYVRTVNGTTYWLHGPNGDDFVFDPAMYTNLGNVMKNKGAPMSFEPSSTSAVGVHTSFPYLDPNSCSTPNWVRGTPNF